jgi:P-type Cu+ transporter
VTSAQTTTDLELAGMSCASCASRVERGLNQLEGVNATVNFALARAHVEHGPDVLVDDLVGVVQSAGYRARVVAAADSAPGAGHDSHTGRADHAGHGDHMDHEPGPGLLVRLIGSAVLALPVVLVSMVMTWHFTGWEWLALALTTPIVFWGAYPFHRAALSNARHGSSTMDTLVSLGTLAAYLWSAVAVVSGAGHVYFEVAAAVTVFLLAGRYVETRAKRSAGAALRALLSLGAKDVTVLRDGVESRVPVSDLAVGETFVVRPGERVATDGSVVEGSSALDTSAMTGEAVPVDVRAGDEVLGGSVNTYGRLLARATKVGTDTQLAQMGRLVAQAQNGKASAQRLADRVSAVFVPVVLAISALTLIAWLAAGSSAAPAFTAAVAVLVIACPCALGLATPTAILVGTGRGAQLGIVFKDPRALESVTRVDTVVLDKTGTVTIGAMTVAGVEPRPGEDADSLLAHAAAVEAASEHPVAAAIVAAARERRVPISAVDDFANEPGIGVSGLVGGTRVTVSREAAGPSSVAGGGPSAGDGPHTAVEVAWDGRVRGTIRLADTVKPTSASAVARLKAMGLTVVLLTGDRPAAAQQVADEVGIERAGVIAGVLPTQKAEVVRRLQSEGRRVAMVGDGVNDSVALAAADIGMAIGTGTDAAIEAADVTLVRGDLQTVPQALRLASRTIRVIKQNLFWAFGYNIAAIPLAALGLLNPMIAGAAMAASSVLVVSNSLRLRSFR